MPFPFLVGATHSLWTTFTPALHSLRIYTGKTLVVVGPLEESYWFSTDWAEWPTQKGWESLREGRFTVDKERQTPVCEVDGYPWSDHVLYSAWSLQSVKQKVKEAGVWQTKTVPIPNAVVDCSWSMDGVNLSDPLIRYYSVPHKTMKCYKTFF